MFLQRYKHPHPAEYAFPQQQQASTLRVGQLLKKMTPLQIKQHMKRNMYINPRTSLIQNTKNLIQSHRQLKQNYKDANQKPIFISTSEHHYRTTFNRNNAQMSSRQTRMAAAKKIRQRIWKSSDITPLIRAHQQSMMRKKNDNYHSIHELTENQQKIHRYKDSMILEQSNFSQRMFQATKNNYKAHSRKNTDKVQTNNMQICQSMDKSISSNQQQNHYHSVFTTRYEKRANTTRKAKRDKTEDNFIQPW